MKPRLLSVALAVLLGLAIVPAVLAHGDEDMDMGAGAEQPKPDQDSYPPTYFTLAEHAGVMYAHIGLMVIAWVFVLPTGELFEGTVWP
jgi:hypothetical protein